MVVAGEVAGLAVGKVLVLTSGLGFSGRVVSTVPVAGGIRCVCEPVSLDDIFSEADLEYSGDIPFEAVEFIPSTPGEGTISRSAARPMGRGRANIQNTFSAEWKPTPLPGPWLTLEPVLKADVRLSLDVRYKTNPEDEVVDFRFLPSLSMVGELGLKVAAKVPDKIGPVQKWEKSVRYARFMCWVRLPVVVPFVGIVPIPVRLNFDLETGLGFQLNAVASVAMPWTLEMVAGLTYTTVDGVDTILSATGSTGDILVKECYGSAEVALNLIKVNCSAYVLGIAGPKASFEPARLTGEAGYKLPTATKPGETIWKFDADTVLSVGLGIGLNDLVPGWFRAWKATDPVEFKKKLLENETKVPDKGVIHGTIS